MTIKLVWPDGKIEHTSSGTTLGDITRSSPGVYLIEVEEQVTIRSESHVLEDEKKYEVVEGSAKEIAMLKKEIESLRDKVGNLETCSAIDTLRRSQTLASSPLLKRAASEPPCNKSKRDFIIQEILDVETVYLKNLTCIESIFHQAFKEKSNSKDGNLGITPTVLKTLFGEISTITNMSRFFRDSLTAEVLKNPNEPHIGRVFSEFAASLRGYTGFVSGYGNRIDLLKQLKKDPQFLEFLQNLEQTNEKELRKKSLNDILIHPVKRVPQYLILVERLLNATEKEHPDYSHLVTAEKLCKQVAEGFEVGSQKIADAKTILEETKDIKIPKKFSDFKVFKQNRFFVFKEEVKVSLPGSTKVSTLNALAFNDCVLFATKARKSKIMYDHLSVLQRYFMNEHIKFVQEKDDEIEIAVLTTEIQLLRIIPEPDSVKRWMCYFKEHASIEEQEIPLSNTRNRAQTISLRPNGKQSLKKSRSFKNVKVAVDDIFSIPQSNSDRSLNDETTSKKKLQKSTKGRSKNTPRRGGSLRRSQSIDFQDLEE